VESTGAELRFTTPQTMFRVRSPANLTSAVSRFAITRDGSRIYFPQAVEQPDTNMIHIMTGWIKP